MVQCFSNFDICQSPGGFVEATSPRVLIVLAWAGTAQERASLTCSQETLLRLVQGPHSENQ